VGFAALIVSVASQRVFIAAVIVYVMEAVRKLLDTPSYTQENRRAEITCGTVINIFLLLTSESINF
jgi:hypothetical protein